MSRTAPEPLRSTLRGLSTARLITAAAALRPTLDLTDPLNATTLALRRLAPLPAAGHRDPRG
jgi:transposase